MVKFLVGVKGDVPKNLSAKVDGDINSTTGIHYSDLDVYDEIEGDWEKIEEKANYFDFDVNITEANTEDNPVKVYGGVSLDLLICDVVGPYAQGNSYIEVDVNTERDPCWKIIGGLEAVVGIDLDIISLITKKHEFTGINLYEEVIAEGNEGCILPYLGKIAFVSERDGNKEIYKMNPDGTDQTNLTNSPNSDTSPAWSPNGNEIAFVSDRGGNHDIYIMDYEGNVLRKITDSPNSDINPVWSYDGNKISYNGGDGKTWVVNKDGTEARRLTNGSGTEYDSSWSPDGKHIAISVFDFFGDGNWEIYKGYLDGSERENLTNNSGLDVRPRYSPDGSEILFESNTKNERDISVMNSDGSGREDLVTMLGKQDSPRWSPDGSEFAYQSFDYSTDNNSEIYVEKRDGLERRNISKHYQEDTNPEWSPDGSEVVYVKEEGNKNIYKTNADGSGEPTRLTDDLADDYSPKWSP